jgi:hypothetical protein
MRTLGVGSLLALLASTAAADPVIETFDTDPITGGRFISWNYATESTFTHDPATKALDAFLDLDNSPAAYVSNAFAAHSDAVDSSFCFTFRVNSFVYGSPSLDPRGFLGLLADQHVGDYGSGLTMALSVNSQGALTAIGRIDPVQGGSYGGSAIGLSFAETYLAVGQYTGSSRQFSLEIYGAAGAGPLVGNSVVTLPTNRTFSVYRIGMQNSRQIIEVPIGGLNITVDNFMTPCEYAGPVPEPSALALLGSILGAGWLRRRMRRVGR